MTIYGSTAELDRNIHHFSPLTAVGSSPAVEVHGSHLTFVHNVTGNATIVDQGSLDNTTWFDLDEAKTHTQNNVDAHFYPGRAVRYVRSTVTSISNGVTVNISVMCH
jgi:hypothetical protein